MSCWSNIEGTWSYNDLIGSKFKVKSLRISSYGYINKSGAFKYSGEVFTLKAIYFRASTDGKVITLYRMEEVCGKLFLPKDLELIELCKASEDPSICGQTKVGPKNIIIPGGKDSEIIEEEKTTTPSPLVKPEDNPVETTSTTTPLPEPEEENIDLFDQNINSWEILNL